MGNKKRDKMISKLLLVFGFLTFPFWLKKAPLKDWLVTYFQTGFFATLIDSIFVQQKRIDYPVRLLPKAFTISILFDYLLFPLIGVVYNQMTYRSGLKGIFGKVFIFSIPLTVVEYVIERKTQLINWKKWTWFHTFSQVTMVTLLGRGFMGLIRKVSDFSLQKPEQPNREKKLASTSSTEVGYGNDS